LMLLTAFIPKKVSPATSTRMVMGFRNAALIRFKL
jgi:hypothetical protein